MFAIVSDRAGSLKLPFFSRLNLKHAAKRLEGYGFRVAKTKIPVSLLKTKLKKIKSSPKFHSALNGSCRHYKGLVYDGRGATDYAIGTETLMPSRANTRCWRGVGTASLSKAGTTWLAG